MIRARLQILSVTSEFYPLVKTGGLADVAGALPAALASQDVTMRTLLPGYPAVLAALDGADALHGWRNLHGGPARLLATRSGGSAVLVLDAPHLYDRSGPYAGPDGDWPDNPIRFGALSRVAAWIGGGLLPGWVPDVVHAHDWQAGLTPAYLHYDAVAASRARPGTVMTVHNLAFQGQAPASLLGALGLPDEAWHPEGVEYYGSIGFLKAGLRFADRITTVSPSYAAEIRTPAGGMGLDGLLRARGGAVGGILNGIDDAAWNPAADPHLASRYDLNDPAPRSANRAALRQRLQLDADPDAPLLGVISRLSWQKGLDLLLDCLSALVAEGAQLAILGAGDPSLEARFAAARSGRVGVHLGYDEGLAHLIQGGGDMLVVPSRFEPCGLTQLCALRYGAIPVVARVGGLADTVIDANEAALSSGVATGFQFAPPTRDALLDAVTRAMILWRDRTAWARLQRNAMESDVGWRRPAAHYAALYGDLAGQG